jgi:DNA-directed RNA polymerase specialized sigma24 family protein
MRVKSPNYMPPDFYASSLPALRNGASHFPETRWTRLRRAVQGGQAYGEIYTDYRYPLYAYARRRGLMHEDALDAVQDFFVEITERSLLEKVREERGKFRSFLLAVFTKFLANRHRKSRALRRGGGQLMVPLDGNEAAALYAQDEKNEGSPEEIFSRCWALQVLDGAFQRLRERYVRDGNGELFDLLAPALEGDLPRGSVPDLAKACDLTEVGVRTAAARLRKRYNAELRRVVQSTLGTLTPEEVEAELNNLCASLA